MRERLIVAAIVAIGVALELAAHADGVALVLGQLRWCPKCVAQSDPYRWR